MASVKFYLKNPKGNSSSIFFRLNYGAYTIVNGKKRYLPMQYHTDETINPTFWNSKKGEAKQVSRFPQYPEFNARLSNIRDNVLNVLRRLKNDDITVTNDVLRNELDILFRKSRNQTDVNSKMELMAFIPYFIETSNKSTGTKKSYSRVYADLQEYETAKNISLTFERIDIDFHDNFIQFLKSKDYAPNTIGTRIKVLKTFMSVAHDRNLHSNTDFKKKAFDKPKEETTGVYLNEKELQDIYNLDYTDNKKYDAVRDWFIIGAYTGLRFSDLQGLKKENIKNNNIEIRTIKTGVSIAVPLHPFVKAIFEKYDYELPKLISNQKFNKYIKEISEKAKIEALVPVEETKGNLKKKTTKRKHQLVSAHTARRSFATNAFIAGVSSIQLMKMTGHKTEKAFLQYIKMSEAENAKKLQLHPFFNKMIVK